MSGIDSYTVSCLHFQNRVWTFAGTAQVDTAQSKFGGASLLLDGDSDYISTPNSTDFDVGSGDFTIDFWVRFNSVTDCTFLNNGNGNYGVRVFFESNNLKTTIYYDTGFGLNLSGSWTPSDSTWYHIALVRNGATTSLYADGTSVASDTSQTMRTPNYCLVVGRNGPNNNGYFNGWIDEFRFTKGLARWTANFTPPSAAADNPSYDYGYTKSLLHFDGTDGSTTITDSTGKSWSVVGTAQLDTAQKNFGSASLLLDGDSDYITTSDSTDFTMGSGDWTFDCWIRAASTSSGNHIVFVHAALGNYSWLNLRRTGSTLNFCSSANGSSWGIADNVTIGTVVQDTWHHVAIARSGNNLNYFFDGTKTGTIDVTGVTFMDSSDPVYIGSSGSDQYWDGWIDELRISKGIARWTANFTPPTSAYDYLETKSLLHFNEPDGSTYTKDTAANWSIDGAQQFYDEKGKVWTVAGNAQLDTAQYKWTASGLFDGSGDYISTPDHADFNFGSGDFTIDFWLYPLTGTTKCCVWSDVDGPATAIFVNYPNYRSITIAVSTNGTSWNLINPDPGGNGVGTTDKLTVLSWNHVAFVRNGNNWRTYINGTVDLNIAASGTVADSSGTKYIGYLYAGDPCYLYGQLDEFRISKGIARWTSDFTPPTEEYDIGIVYSPPALTDTDSALAPSINHVFPIPATDTDSFLVPSINHVFPIPISDTDTMVAPKYNIVLKMPVYLTDSDTVVAPYFGRTIPLTSTLTDTDIPLSLRIEGIPVPRHRVKVNY